MSSPQITPEYLAETRAPQILAGSIAPTVIGTILVVCRCYTRSVISKAWGSDDTLIFISWILSISLTILNCLGVNYGVGKHIQASTINDSIIGIKVGLASRMCYQLVLSTTKLGICAFYLRVFRDRMSKMISVGMMVLVVLYTIPLELIVILRCKPIAAAWDFSIANQKCMDVRSGIYANAILNILVDAGLIAFIIPRVVPLKMARRQKITLLAIVSLGFLVIVAAIVRLVLNLKFLNSIDFTYTAYDITTWSSVEVNTGLFCASAPCIRPLLRKIAPGIMSSLSGTYSGPSGALSNKHTHNTHLSTLRRGPPNAFELNSRGENDFGEEGVTTNAYWGGNSEGVDDGDNDSQKAVLSDKPEIKKTVSIIVTNSTTSPR